MSEFDGKCCEMFDDTDATTERIYRELWARKPLAWRIWQKWVDDLERRNESDKR